MIKNHMLDLYTIGRIFNYLKKCKECKKLDTYNYNKECCFCKKYFCDDCKDKLIRNYNYCETISNYCSECNEYCFKIHF